MAHEMRRQNINVVLIGAHLGIFTTQGMKAFVPKGHSVNDAIRFGRGSQVFISFSCQFKGKPQDASYPPASEDRLLHGDLIVGTVVDATSDVGIFPFVILPYDG